MPFDVQAARASGYSDDEIADHLGQQSGFDVVGAKRAGYGTNEILDHLSGSGVPAAQRELPNGVAPSKAGAGRGSVQPASEAAPPAVETPSPTPGFIDSVGNAMNGVRDWATGVPLDGERKGSVLSTLRPDDPKFNFKAASEASRLIDDQSMPSLRQSQGIPQDSKATGIGAGMQDYPLPVRAAAKALSGMAQGSGGVWRAAGDLTGIESLSKAGSIVTKAGNEFEQGMGDITRVDGFGPKSPVPYLANMAEGAASSLAQSAVMAGTLGPQGVIPMMSVMTAGQEYDKARNAGLSPSEALAGALPKGAFEAIGEKFTGLDKVAGAMGTLLNKGASSVAKHEAAGVLIQSGIKEVPGEVITYLGQSATDLLPGIGLNQNMTMTQFVDGLRDTVVQATMMGGAMAGTGAHVAQGSRDQKSAEDIAKSKGFLVRDQRIQALRDAGETATADQMQLKHDVESEISRLPGNEDFSKVYRDMRTDGVKPAEAAARSAVAVTFKGMATGIPEKALSAAMDKAKGMPLDQVPGFLQKLTTGLTKRGLMQPFEGMDQLGSQLEAALDDAMDTALGAVYTPVKPAMDSIQSMEQKNALALVESGQEATNSIANDQTTQTAGPAKGQAAPSQTTGPVEGDAATTGDVSGARDAAIQAAGIDQAAHGAATSPLNDLAEPTQGQKEAGNYKVGRINLHGLNISIENPQGSERKGTSPDGSKWVNTLAAHYGYIRGTEGNDGDHVDTFVGPNPASQKVFVVDQVNKDGSFDEHKVVLGADNLQQADDLYHANYHTGWTGRGAITEMPIDQFKKWVKDGVKTKPLAEITTPDAGAAPVDGANAVQPAAGGVAAAPANPVYFGRDNVAIGEGGRAFKTRKAADDARKLNTAMRVVRADGGYALTEKTAAQLTAQENAAKRLRNPQTSAKGEPIPAHAMIAAAGGLAPDTRADMGMQGNVQIGNRRLFAGEGKGLTIERATERLVEEGYLPNGATHDQARDLIKRSLSKPQYNAEGTERMAAAELEARQKAHEEALALAVAEVEDASDNQFEEIDADIPEVDAASNVSEAEAMRSMGFTEQEIEDATAKRPGIQSQDSQNRSGIDAGSARGPQADHGQRASPTGEDTRGRSDTRRQETQVTPQQTPAPAGVSVSGSFGPILTEYRHDAQGAIKALTDLQDGEAVAALHHPEVGDIDLVWGTAGTKESNGSGLAKLVKWHPEVLSDLQGIISSLKVVSKNANRIQLESETHKAAVRLEWDGVAKHWLLTAFEKKVAGSGTTTDITADGVEDDTARLKSGRASVSQPSNESKFQTEQRPDGTLAVKGDTAAIREILKVIPSHSLTPMRGGILVGRTQAEKAMAILQPAELTEPTRAELVEQQERAERASKDKDAVDRKADKQARNDDDRKRIAQASEAAADTFELGGDAMTNLTGQQDIFSSEPVGKQDPVKIEDAGEKIGGARKDRWKERGLDLSDLDTMSESEGAELATKANVWKPDYAGMVQSGTRADTAAFIKVVYDSLAAKPKKNTPDGRRLYVTMMHQVRSLYTELAQFDTVGNKVPRRAMLDAAETLKVRLGLRSQDPAAVKAGKELLFSVYKGRSDPFVVSVNEEMRARKLVADGFPNAAEPWKSRLVVGEYGGSGLTARGVELIVKEAEALGTPVTAEQVQAGVYRVVTKPGKALAYLPTRADAEAAAKTIYAGKLKAAANDKAEPTRPHLDILKRDNLPQRIDRDVTADDFVKDFGFRGVEFGNWAAQDERQRILNMAYDGLRDLAAIMGIPPKALSLNGSLGMAFGARGGGKFAAHYEPGKLVINMTKLQGGGSMAHEWAHALDHYLGELDRPDAYTTAARGASGWYTEAQYKGVPVKRMEQVGKEWKTVEKLRLDNLRPELAKAFDQVMSALFSGQETKAQMVRGLELQLERTQSLAGKESDPQTKAMYERMATSQEQNLAEARQEPEDKTFPKGRSSYAANAQKLSGKSASGYWSRPTEMFARAFESWVFDKVAAMGAKSDYLVHGVEEDRFAGGNYKGNPYPTGQERATINAAFDKLASTIKIKETDKGVAMFARGALGADAFRLGIAPRKFMPVSDVQKAVDQLTAKWKDGPRIGVVLSPEELPVDAPSDARGLIHNGVAYIVAANHRDRKAVALTLGHEVIGHYGLWKMLGADGTRQFQRNVQLAIKSGNVPLNKIAARVRELYVDENDKFNLSPAAEANEIAAFAVEDAIDADGNFKPGFGFFKAVWAKVADFLRGLGIDIKFTNTELQGMLVSAMRGLETGQRLDGGSQGLVAAARSDVGNPEENALAALSQNDSLFQHTKSDKDSVEGIAADVNPAITVRKLTNIPGETRYVFTTPDGNTQRMSVRPFNQYANEETGTLYGYHLDKNHEMTDVVMERPGKNADHVQGKDDVYIDVSLMQPGQYGSQIYSIAQNYAHNTGKVFIGDPNGLSDHAMKRRVDNMLSSALKFGTTEHLGPHPRQVKGDLSIGVPALDWTYGDHVGNITNLIKLSNEIYGQHNPITFEPISGRFVDSEGTELDDSAIRSIVQDGRLRKNGIGITTAKRDAILRSLVREGGEVVRGPGGRDGVLEKLLHVGLQHGLSTRKVFYARGGQGNGTGVTPGLFAPTVWNTPDPTRTDRIIYELQDGRVDLKRVQEAITKSGQQIEEKWDARLAETLYPGRVAYRSQRFLETEAHPLLKAMAVQKVAMDELADYLHARGAEERNKQIAKVNPALPDGGSGKNSNGVLLTNDAARDYLAAINPERKQVLDVLAAKVDAITAGTRTLLVSEGLEKQETIDAWTSTYKNYVPMFRDEAQSGAPHPQGSGFSVKGSASKRATGSTKEVTNILAHVLMQREAAITRAEKNRVAVALYGQALSHPNPEFWTTIKPNMTAAQIGAELQAMGVDPMTAAVGMERAPTITTVDEATGKKVDRPNPLYKSLPGAIPLKVNAEDRVLMINTENERGARLAENLKNLDGLTKLDIASSIIGKSTRWLASVNTQYNPAFGLVNATRDSLEAAINLSSTPLAGKQGLLFAKLPMAMAGIYKSLRGDSTGTWAKLYEQFQADGAQTGFKEMFRDAAERTKAIDKMLKHETRSSMNPGKMAHAALDVLDGFNTIGENIVRLSAYKVALDNGMTRPQAAKLARELTVDFNRKGRAGRELGPLYAFFNASVQGTARMAATLADPKRAAKIIGGGLALGSLQAMVLLLSGYDDDEPSEWVKANGFVIPLGKGDDGNKKFAIIPYPPGFKMIPNTGRIMTELALNGAKNASKKVGEAIGSIASTFNPFGGGDVFTMDGALKTIAPTLIDPFIELGFNKNFAGKGIEKKDYGSETDPRPGVARTKESTMRTTTGQAYMAISKAMNWASGGTDYVAGAVSPTPERIRYLAQTVGGGVLREIEKTINASTAESRGEKVKISQIPVVGRFRGEVDQDEVQKSRYFEAKAKIEKADKTLKALENANQNDAANAFEKENPEVDLAEELHQVQAKIRDLDKQAVEVINDHKKADQIDKDRIEKMNELNAAVIELEEAADKKSGKSTPAAKIKGWRREAVEVK